MSDEENLPRVCRIQVVEETPDGGSHSLCWDFLAGEFDGIVADLTARHGPAFFEQKLSADDLAQIGELRQPEPMGLRRWPGGEHPIPGSGGPREWIRES